MTRATRCSFSNTGGTRRRRAGSLPASGAARGGGGSPDKERGNLVKAYIVLTPGHAASAALEEEIRNHVRGRLAPYEYPKEIEFIDALPMTPTGKGQARARRLRAGG